MKKFLIALLLTGAAISLLSEPAKLNVEQRGNDVVLFITGGVSNVQYQVWTPASNNVNDTNTWYYWRRVYSRDFLSNPEYGEVLIYGTNTSQQPKRFFQIRGVLEG